VFYKLIYESMEKKLFSGFTLIELLVVITIIGILATWAVTIYTAQLQKARDGTRITALETLKWWIEQSYQDLSMYPEKPAFTWVRLYVPVLPIDPKTWQVTTNTALDFAYNVWNDMNWVNNQIYEVSAWLENTSNISTKATNSADGWNDANRLEMWIILSNNFLNTSFWSVASGVVSWANSWTVVDLWSWWWTFCTNWGWTAIQACWNSTGSILVIR